jgi:hypothetical protein
MKTGIRRGKKVKRGRSTGVNFHANSIVKGRLVL